MVKLYQSHKINESTGNKTTEYDSLLNKVIEEILVLESVSWLQIQRKFAISYTRVQKILHQLENLGLIERRVDRKPRKVFKEILFKSLLKNRLIN